MKTKICLTMIQSSIQHITEVIRKNPDLDTYEIWVDYLAGQFSVILSETKNLILRYPNKLIICFRRKDGKAIQMDFKTREKILELCARTDVLVDCDIEKQKDDLMYITETNSEIKFIASSHNFEKTPDTHELSSIIKKMEQYNPTIYKIATYCNNPDDAVRLMQLLLKLKKEGKKAIVLGMGDYGKITRVFGAMYGNEITFVSEKRGAQSAPGQMTKEELENVIRILNS